jgi:HrpA-like RNA helicase
LTKRTDNFYVVVASATIDPKIFLKFFEKEKCKPLEVPGRVFPVTLLNWPEIIENEKDNDEDDRNEKLLKRLHCLQNSLLKKLSKQ